MEYHKAAGGKTKQNFLASAGKFIVTFGVRNADESIHMDFLELVNKKYNIATVTTLKQLSKLGDTRQCFTPPAIQETIAPKLDLTILPHSNAI